MRCMNCVFFFSYGECEEKLCERTWNFKIWGFWCNLRSSGMADHDQCFLSQCGIVLDIMFNCLPSGGTAKEDWSGGRRKWRKYFESNYFLILLRVRIWLGARTGHEGPGIRFGQRVNLKMLMILQSKS